MDERNPAKPTGTEQAKPLRVAQILNRMDSGGIEAVVLNYYRHIDRSKVQFDFYFAEGSSLPQRQELEQLGAGPYPIPPYSHPTAPIHLKLYSAEQSFSMQSHLHSGLFIDCAGNCLMKDRGQRCHSPFYDSFV